MGVYIISESKNDKKKVNDSNQEELYFDGEKYYTREEFFNPDEEKEVVPKKDRKWMKFSIISVLIIALLSNVWALWPRLFNTDSFQFLAISRELSQNENIQSYKESVVVIRAGDSKGTGFYISEEGHILTNYHVIDDAPALATATFEDGKRYRADVIETYPDIDIALLKIEAEEERPILSFETTWERGTSIYVIGNPLFFNYIANKGNIIDLTNVKSKTEPMIMIDAPIYKGNSGSPVINENGKVVGVVYATTRVDFNGERIRVGLAVPVDYFLHDIQNFTNDE